MNQLQRYDVRTESGQISCYKTGKGPVLLGLSGFGCSHYNYLDLLENLSSHFSVYIIDNRGIGNSTKTTADYSLADVARDALLAMKFFEVDQFSLMGISMGGFIAQELVKLAPEKIQALALMCTLSSGDDFIQPVALTELGLRQFSSLEPKLQAEYSTFATVHPTLNEKNPACYQHIIEMRIQHKADIEELVRQNRAAVNFLSKPFDLSIINCPTLAMAGAADRFVNPENIKAFQKNIKNCQTKLIEESDHFFFMEKPGEVADSLLNFFKDVL